MKWNRVLPLAAVLLAAVVAVAAMAAGAEAPEITDIVLSDQGVTVNGGAASCDPADSVYVGADIVYYKEGTDAAYGEGTAADMHSAAEAAAHTVVTITQPGTYRLRGSLSRGQIAVDLGKQAKDDPAAKVTVILDGADVTCTVAPAFIVYNVYECDRAFVAYDNGDDPDFKGRAVVDTAEAGINIILADGSENTFAGSHVARIYKEGTVKKLHKYDAAFHSKMSMNIAGDGHLSITGDNEGLDSQLHLTINGGNITIRSQDDGINTNEDGISVTTINGGHLSITAGLGAEGDGIDSNGYLVINGGWLESTANPGADGGIDAELPILINGGTVIAQGGRNDEADAVNSAQPFIQLSFAQAPAEGAEIRLVGDGAPVDLRFRAARGCRSVTITSDRLQLDTTYRLYVDGALQCWTGNAFGMMHGGMGGMRPEGDFPRPEGDFQRPEGDFQRPAGDFPRPNGDFQRPEGDFQRPNGDFQRPEGFDRDRFPAGPFGDGAEGGEPSAAFVLTATDRSFSGIRAQDDALPFTDLATDDPAYDAVRTLYRLGAIQGTGADTFSPDMTLTRAQAVTVLARLAGAQAAETDAFSDVVPGSWYAGYVGWAVDSGIVQGDGQGHFYPDMTVTAQQMELMLRRYRADYQSTAVFDGELTRAQLARMVAAAVK